MRSMRTKVLLWLVATIVVAMTLASCGGTSEPADSAGDAPAADDAGTTDDAAADSADDSDAADTASDGASDAGGDSDADAGTDAGDSGDGTTITVWSWRTEDEDAYNEIFDVYEEANPGITVEFVPYVNTDYNNILATGLTGDGGPDVVQLRAYGAVQPLIEAGQIVPLDGKVDSLSNFTEDILQGATGRSDGQIYGVPFGVQAFAAYYNTAIFDELGLSEPTTWDEFINVLDTLKSNDYTPIAAPAKDVWMLPILHDAIGAPRYGGNEFVSKVLSGETNFEDPNYVASLQVMADMQQYFPDDVVGVSYNDSRTFFASETAGIFIGGSFELGYWKSDAPNVNLGVFQIPAPPDSTAPASTPGWMDGSFGVNSLSDAPDESIALVNWMGTPEFGQMFADKILQVSPVQGVTPTDPILAEFVELYNSSPVPYLHLVYFRYGEPLGSDLDAEGIQSMYLGESTPADVATKIQEGISQWFEPTG